MSGRKIGRRQGWEKRWKEIQEWERNRDWRKRKRDGDGRERGTER